MADATEENETMQSHRAPFSVQNPCRFFQEIFRALLECLGLDSWGVRDETGGENSSSTEGTSSAADPPADPPATTAATSLGRAPPRPVISPGPGPQTNTNVN